jgi:hypothetical protein
MAAIDVVEGTKAVEDDESAEWCRWYRLIDPDIDCVEGYTILGRVFIEQPPSQTEDPSATSAFVRLKLTEKVCKQLRLVQPPK